tara:strand:+ start:2465 stop:2611 length:147 start_codon:yes stop_codon:yes gene_type:complete
MFRFTSWKIVATLSTGNNTKEIDIVDLPNWVATPIDEYLGELEGSEDE